MPEYRYAEGRSLFGFMGWFVNPETARFDNPEMTCWRIPRKGVGQGMDEDPHGVEEIVRTAENHQAGSSFGREAEHIGKIQIKSHQDMVLQRAVFVERSVGRPEKPLIPNRRGFVTRLAQELGVAGIYAFIEFDFHASFTRFV